MLSYESEEFCIDIKGLQWMLLEGERKIIAGWFWIDVDSFRKRKNMKKIYIHRNHTFVNETACRVTTGGQISWKCCK